MSPTSILLNAGSFVPHLSPLECGVVCPPPQSSPIHGGGRCCHMRVLKLHVAASPSPASRGKAGMGDSAQRRSFVPHLSPHKCEVVYPPPQSSPIHGGGRCCHMRVLKLHVAASPSPALRGKAGMGDSAQRRSFVPHLNPHKCEDVCPPPQSSPIHGGGRCCHMRVLKLHVAASPSPASRGKAGIGDSAQRTKKRAENKKTRRGQKHAQST